MLDIKIDRIFGTTLPYMLGFSVQPELLENEPDYTSPCCFRENVIQGCIKTPPGRWGGGIQGPSQRVHSVMS